MINVIDLFSGAGGLTFGFQKKIENNVFVSREDFNIRFANEFNSDAAEAFRQNYPKITMIINLSSPSDEVIKREFNKAVEISLSKWDELNALRGEYMSENAEIEHELKTILGVQLEDHRNYKSLYTDFKNTHLSYRDIKDNDQLLTEWFQMIKKRNALAHSKEQFSSEHDGYVISTIEEGNVQILECTIDSERKTLIDLTEKVKTLIQSRPKVLRGSKRP
ncbi:C-5 cytosine-specific DNA methylase [Streptococcus sanguinis]|uniref:DNA cytosine methyltransferase n=1 Tax=Streptococcus sanguinis TaxID=1305 RepID=UPI000F98AD07|nr:DNA cytosine methyltransferase [Streptococcus sanguinis]RSI19424.1 C-5 cytosine-specific DNA methylase [Streptococcus sanguinis]